MTGPYVEIARSYSCQSMDTLQLGITVKIGPKCTYFTVFKMLV